MTERWSLATRIAFRFLLVYFVLYLPASHTFQSMPGGGRLSESYFDLWDAAVLLAGEDVFHRQDIVLDVRGVGNTPYGWILFLCLLASAALIAVIWSVLGRNSARYERLHSGLRLLLRYMLAGAMISYGAIKVIPYQMTAPPPMAVLSFRLGDLSPSHLMWWTIGASPQFETFIGLAELLGGLLLLVPRTALLGALVCAANALTIFLLNMCYDVVVKLPSLHLLVMAVVLLAPDLRRLAGVFLLNRRVERARAAPVFANRRLDAALQLLVVLSGVYLMAVKFDSTAEAYGLRHPPRPPLYGHWSVEAFAVDGREVPLFTDPERWRWVSFLRPGSIYVENMIGSGRAYKLDLDLERRTMRLDGSAFSLERPETGVLILHGSLDGRPARVGLRTMPLIREIPRPYKG